MNHYAFRFHREVRAIGLALVFLNTAARPGAAPVAVSAQAGVRGFWEMALDRTGPSDPGRLWVTELQANQIGMYDLASGRFREFPVPTTNSEPRGLVFDRKTPEDPGTVWFTEFHGYKLGRLEVATGTLTELPGIGVPAYPLDIVVDRQNADDPGRIWFSMHGMNRIGRLDVGTMAVKTYNMPPPDPAPIGIFFERPPGAERGYLWVAQASDANFKGRVFRFDIASESFRLYSLGDSQNAATQVIVDRRGIGEVGYLWVNELTGANIVRVDLATGQVVKRPVPFNQHQHRDIVLDRGQSGSGQAYIWFSDTGGNRIGKMNADTGATQFFGVPGGSGQPVGLVLDRKDATDPGRIWFAESQRDRLGMINIATGEVREITLPPLTGSEAGRTRLSSHETRGLE